MKKVCIFTPHLSGFGGTETVISNLFSEFDTVADSNYHLKLFCVGGYENGEWLKGIKDRKIISFGKSMFLRKIKYVFFLPFLLPFLIAKEKDAFAVVVTHPIMWYILFLFKKIFRRKYLIVAWYHFSLKNKPIKRTYLNKADGYFAISSGIAGQYRNLGISKEKIRTIYNPVLRNSVTVPRTFSDDKRRFIYVGRVMLDGQKNLRYLIDVLANVHGNWELLIYGHGEISKVKAYIQSKNLSAKIKFMGFKKDVWTSLSRVDALLLTSKFEGFPMVLNEAISVGIPVISVNCETGPEDIINRNNGFLVEKNDQSLFIYYLQKMVDGQIQLSDYLQIKNSINQFYSDNYCLNFCNALASLKKEN
ncbi:glycosyltransferase [Secundilactobacillus mixtipabuli]|uniref:Glycosyltransferase group 1 n=1 Tax=Secundilactobacillus mixtipabuli TaxID=1435342 RepID=A0A1Z5IC48_9LACO|nr:glycosyltransferase [Secundilactobacillus mixtipabuli]GAW99215.1 glycosyltransferase group 1 [Secundilactobacillus mixtipabuli]